MIDLAMEVDKKKTKANARQVLKQCRRLARMSGRSIADLKSPVLSDMPKGSSSGNLIESKVINRISAEQDLAVIESALRALCCLHRQILYYSFCDVEPHSNYEIGQLVSGYSDKNIEKLKSVALIEFAEAYDGGSLLVYL